MPDAKTRAPLSTVLAQTLRKALEHGESFNGLQAKCHVDRQSMARFLAGETSLRLDLADRLAAHFALEVRPRRQEESRRRRKDE